MISASEQELKEHCEHYIPIYTLDTFILKGHQTDRMIMRNTTPLKKI